MIWKNGLYIIFSKKSYIKNLRGYQKCIANLFEIYIYKKNEIKSIYTTWIWNWKFKFKKKYNFNVSTELKESLSI